MIFNFKFQRFSKFTHFTTKPTFRGTSPSPPAARWYCRHAEERRTIACSMLAEGLDPAVVAKNTGLTDKEIQTLAQK